MANRKASNSGIAGTRYSDASAGTSKINDVPDAPTIGVVTDGGNGASVTVAYTAAVSGGPATTFTATSNPGNFTGTGTSPITVSGLTTGTSYTFTVTASNSTGSSAASSASASIAPVLPPLAVSGGTLTTTGGYNYRAFTSSGTLSVQYRNLTGADVLVLAGGAGSGFKGGGGAGGLLYYSNQTFTPANYTVTVGGGGGAGGNGGASQFGSLGAATG